MPATSHGGEGAQPWSLEEELVSLVPARDPAPCTHRAMGPVASDAGCGVGLLPGAARLGAASPARAPGRCLRPDPHMGCGAQIGVRGDMWGAGDSSSTALCAEATEAALLGHAGALPGARPRRGEPRRQSSHRSAHAVPKTFVPGDAMSGVGAGEEGERRSAPRLRSVLTTRGNCSPWKLGSGKGVWVRGLHSSV